MTGRDPRHGLDPAPPGPHGSRALGPAHADRPDHATTPRPTTRRPAMQTFHGIAVSPGVAIGPAHIHDPRRLGLPTRTISPAQVAAELDRLESGIKAAHTAALADQNDARGRLGPHYADILAAHAQMIADSTLLRDARQRIQTQYIAAEHAVIEVLDVLAGRLELLADPFLASRAADIRDIQRRIVEHLLGARAHSTADAAIPHGILLAHDLTPSQAAQLEPHHTLGFATEAGGRASHTAIVAAALEIPAVVGLGPFLDQARGSQTAIIDGHDGLVILDPNPATLKRYRKAATDRQARFDALASQVDLPAVTRDGTRIELYGNIEFPGEVAACRERNADGIGLYRTEFLYLASDRPPTEDEQIIAYRSVVQAMKGRPVTIRTLDLGADRLVSYGPAVGELRNPSLGLRSIRLSLRDPDLFQTQLRAILRVSAEGPVRIMFPLISTLGELREARAHLDQVADQLRAEGVPVPAQLSIGAMIEVPSAAVTADLIARETDFLAIGTNDLIQYALAVDRTDETVANLYNPADPAVLRLIALVVAAGRAQGKPVSVCGAMGGDPLFTMLLVGMGLRHLSMAPHQLPEVKRVLRLVDREAAESLVTRAMACDTAAEVEAQLQASLRRLLMKAGKRPKNAPKENASDPR